MKGSSFYPLPLKNLYKLISAGSPIDVNGVKSILKIKSERTANQYLKTLEWISKRIDSPGTLDGFREAVAKALIDEFELEVVFEMMRGKAIPITPSGLASALKERRVQISENEAKAIISWLKEAEFLKERRIGVLTLNPEERILEDIISKGAVTYASLRRKYGDYAKLAVFSLWKKGLLSVPSLEKYEKELEGVEDPIRIPGQHKGKIFSVWQDRMSGEFYSELVLPQKEKISVRWQV